METVADILIEAAEQTPDHCALISGEKTLTYRELLSLAMAVGTGLKSRGIGRGDCIMTVLQNHQGAAVLHWAAQIYGIAICPINWRATSAELTFFAGDCGAKAIFYDNNSKSSVLDAETGPGVFLAEAPAGGWHGARDIWPHILHDNPDPLPNVESKETSVILYTSGTTGRGKGVPRSHKAELAAARAQVAQNALLPGDVALGVMPLYHTMGVRILLSTALLGGTFVCQDRFDAATTLTLIARHGITSLYLVPTLYHDLLREQDGAASDLSSITCLGFAGAPMPHGLLRDLVEVFPGVPMVNHYGSSEIYTYTISQDPAAKRRGLPLRGRGVSGRSSRDGPGRGLGLGHADLHRGPGSGARARLAADDLHRPRRDRSRAGHRHRVRLEPRRPSALREQGPGAQPILHR